MASETTDRELLELAAKAVGIESSAALWARDGVSIIQPEGKKWNPLADDGDALRLAVALQVAIHHSFVVGSCGHFGVVAAWSATQTFDDGVKIEYPDGGANAATRRAIVLAAAEIGRSHHG